MDTRRLFSHKWIEAGIALGVCNVIASALNGFYRSAAATVILLMVMAAFFLKDTSFTFARVAVEKFAFVSFIALSFLYLSSIPKIASLPFSPKYLLFVITMFLLLLSGLNKDLGRVYNSAKPVWFYFLLALVFSVLLLNVNNAIPSIEGIFLLFFIIVLAGSKKERAVFLTRFIALFTLISAAWFLGNLFFYEKFLFMREIIYGSYLDPEKPLTTVAMLRPTGLTFNHHVMGYHMTAAVVIIGLLAFTEVKKGFRVLWIMALPVVGIATILTAQRSVLPAVAVAFLVFLVMFDSRKILYLFLAGAASFVIVSNVSFDGITYSDVKTVQSRLESEEDVSSRLGWQVSAIKMIADNPIGLSLAGKSWENEVESYGADFSAFGDEIFAVHNSYLGVMLKYGWIGAVAVIAVLLLLVRRIRFALKCYGSENGNYAAVTGLTLLALLIQAMFHNTGIFTNDPVSVMVMGLFLAWVNVLCPNERPAVMEGAQSS